MTRSRATPAPSKRNLADRIDALERAVAELCVQQFARPAKDWRRTIGMFGNDPLMKEVFDEAAKFRERDRARARPRRRTARVAK
jgi:hypothetical protein